MGNIFDSLENICRDPSRGAQPLKSGMSKFLKIICLGYSKLVSGDAWNNAKEIRSIRARSPEKRPLCCQI